jgi:hypothetical protein
MLEALLVHCNQYLTSLLRMKLSVYGYGEMEMKEYLGAVLHVPDIVNEHIWALTNSAIDAGIAKLDIADETAVTPTER